MKLTSVGVLVLVVVMALAIVAGDNGTLPSNSLARTAPFAPTNPPTPEESRPLPHEQFALLPVTGLELIDAMHADQEGEATTPRPRHSLAARTPERQARGLSGSA
jgi:hypothetical protein